MRTPGFLAEENLQRLQVGYAKLSQVYLLLVLENYWDTTRAVIGQWKS